MGTSFHLLTGRELSTLPVRVISLDCHPYVCPHPQSPFWHRHVLQAAGIVCTDYRSGWPCRKRSYVCNSTDDCRDCIESLLHGQHATWLVAHNLAYDLALSGFWLWLDECWASLGHFCFDDPPATMHCRVGSKELICVDILNYWRKPLCEMAEHLGLPLRSHEGFSGSTPDAGEIALEHATVTAEATDCIITFLARHMGGGWKPTAPGIAWSAYRSRQWGDRIRVHADKTATELERHAYVGPPVWCHKRGEINDDVFILDTNNMYGHAMHSEPFPIRLRTVANPSRYSLAKHLVDGRGIVARCRIETDTLDYPQGGIGDIAWRCGRFDTTLAGPDLILALRRKELVSVYQAAIYDMGRPFVEYVEHWYSARRDSQESGDKAGAALGKLVTSTLFGRFGQKSRGWQPYEGPPPLERWCVWHEPVTGGNGYVKCRSVAGTAQRECKKGEWKHSAVAIPAYVTAYARALMRSYVECAGAGNVYYQDCDCLHVNKAGFDRLEKAEHIHPTRLGKLKLISENPWMVYHGPRDYQTPQTVVKCGLSSDARQIADGIWLQDNQAGLATIAESGPINGMTVKTVRHTRG